MSPETILLLISCYCVGFLSLQLNSETKSICTLRCLQCKSKGCALEIDTPLLIWSGRDLDHETLHNTILQQSPAQTLASGHFHQVICDQVWTGYHLWQWMPPWKKLSDETHMTWLNLWPCFLEMAIKCTAWSMAAKLLTPWSIQFHKTRLIFNSTNELMWSALSYLWQTNDPFFVLLWLILVRTQTKWIVRMASDCANFWGEAVSSHQCQQATEFMQVWNSTEEVGEASTLQQKKIIKTFAIHMISCLLKQNCRQIFYTLQDR